MPKEPAFSNHLPGAKLPIVYLSIVYASSAPSLLLPVSKSPLLAALPLSQSCHPPRSLLG
jgi:hypothetical protein